VRLTSGPEHSLLTNRPVIVTQSDLPSSSPPPLQLRGSPYSEVERIKGGTHSAQWSAGRNFYKPIPPFPHCIASLPPRNTVRVLKASINSVGAAVISKGMTRSRQGLEIVVGESDSLERRKPGGGARGPHCDAPRRAEGGGSRPRTVRARKSRKGEFRRPPTPEEERRGAFASLGNAAPPGFRRRATCRQQRTAARLARDPLRHLLVAAEFRTAGLPEFPPDSCGLARARSSGRWRR
jgi:hypothetical protein